MALNGEASEDIALAFIRLTTEAIVLSSRDQESARKLWALAQRHIEPAVTNDFDQIKMAHAGPMN
jgi:hypothetical protein